MGPLFEHEWMCFDAFPLHLNVDLQKWAANIFLNLFSGCFLVEKVLDPLGRTISKIDLM